MVSSLLGVDRLRLVGWNRPRALSPAGGATATIRPSGPIAQDTYVPRQSGLDLAAMQAQLDELTRLVAEATRVIEALERLAAAEPAPAPARPGVPSDPNAFFFNQFRHAKWNPNGPSRSANCGPASLAMALKAFGIVPPGADPGDPESMIDKTRRAMTGNEDDHAYTNVHAVLKGARAVGAEAEPVNGLGGVEAALADGRLVVLAGNPHAYGPRFGGQMSQYDGGHFILVTGRTAGGFLINDPLSRVGSVEVSREELKTYMGYQGWNVGVAVGG